MQSHADPIVIQRRVTAGARSISVRVREPVSGETLLTILKHVDAGKKLIWHLSEQLI